MHSNPTEATNATSKSPTTAGKTEGEAPAEPVASRDERRLEWMTAVAERGPDAPLDVYDIAVIFVLTKHMKPDGSCFPSTRAIAREGRISRPTAESRLAHLVGLGYLRRSQPNPWKPTQYQATTSR